MLEARELMQMDLRVDLVVLSACETARGRIGVGEGELKVEESSTTELMV